MPSGWSSMRVTGKGSIQACEDKPRKRCRKWRLFVRADGRQRTRVVHGTYSQAEDALEAFKRELEGRVESAELFDGYAESVASYRRASGLYASGTQANFERDVRTLCRVMGDFRLCDITPQAARDFLTRIRNGENASGRVLSGTYMQDIHGTFKAVMASAVADGLAASNPLDLVQAPRNDTQERDWMPPDEFAAFTDALCSAKLDGRVMALLFMAQLGLRRGEACALRIADIRDGSAHVHLAVKERSGKVGPPKSRAGVRTLPMPPLLSCKVDEWLGVVTSSAILRRAETVCCNTRGDLLRPQNLYRWWEANKASFGAEGYTLHQIRHSNLSMMARHMSPFDLKTWAGWSSIEPARVYIHQDETALRAAVKSAFGGFEKP